MRWLIGLAGLLAVGATAGPAPVPIKPSTFVVWDGKVVRYALSGITLSISPERWEATPGSFPTGFWVPVVRIESREMKAAIWRGLPEDMKNFPPLRIAIGRLNRGDPRPTVILDQYAGGAHCCEQLTAVVAGAGGWTKVDLGEWDMETPRFPRDVSGDGVADLIVPDRRFHYAFASYAESFAPPRIFNLVRGRRVEVSTRAAFARLFREDLDKTRAACVKPNPDYSPNGACAAYVADAARLGQFDPAWRVMQRSYHPQKANGWLPDGCRVAIGDRPCPAAQVIHYRTYPEALTAFLKQSGYIR